MKVFVSYKYSGLEVNMVISKLKKIKSSLNSIGIDSHIFNLDEKDFPEDPVFLMETFKSNIADSDVFVSLFDNEKYSEGMLLELGIAYGMGKKVLIFIQNEYRNDFFLVYGTSNDVIYFDDFLDFKHKMINYLNNIKK